MKFAHLADCHIGGWREPKLRELNTLAFCCAIDTCIKEQVDFVIIAGDLFNTAFPGVDSLAIATRKLRELHDNNISVYAIAGSHDFSPSGRTMLDVLEEAGLLTNVSRGVANEDGSLKLLFTVDKKTGIKITGVIGKKGGLDSAYYAALDRASLEAEPGEKIFVFHAALAELKPADLSLMDAIPVSYLPTGFRYYAGGHVHITHSQTLNNRENIVYPGPTFPNNMSELEKLGKGFFVIVENWVPRTVAIELKKIVQLACDCTNKTLVQVFEEAKKMCDTNVTNAIVLFRATGKVQGRPSDIKWKEITAALQSNGAYVVLLSTSGVTSSEFEEVKLPHKRQDELETLLIQEHAGKVVLNNKDADAVLSASLLNVLSLEKEEAERSFDFEKRLKTGVDRMVGVDE